MFVIIQNDVTTQIANITEDCWPWKRWLPTWSAPKDWRKCDVEVLGHSYVTDRPTTPEGWGGGGGGRLCFHRCVPVRTGRGEEGYPSIWSQVHSQPLVPSHVLSGGRGSLVPCPFWKIPSHFSHVLSGGGVPQERQGLPPGTEVPTSWDWGTSPGWELGTTPVGTGQNKLRSVRLFVFTQEGFLVLRWEPTCHVHKKNSEARDSGDGH